MPFPSGEPFEGEFCTCGLPRPAQLRLEKLEILPLPFERQHSNLLMLDMLQELNYGNFVMLLKSRAHFSAGMAIALRL
jgi:hypothetical protein